MGNVAREIKKYRDDVVLFMKGIGTGIMPYQEDTIRKLAEERDRRVSPVRFSLFVPFVSCRSKHPSRGWRRHVRRMKAEKRR